MARAKWSSATTANICCSVPHVISNRLLATRNLRTSIATWSAFISSLSPRRLQIRSRRRAMKSARRKKSAKKKRQKKRKRKSRRRRSEERRVGKEGRDREERRRRK